MIIIIMCVGYINKLVEIYILDDSLSHDDGRKKNQSHKKFVYLKF